MGEQFVKVENVKNGIVLGVAFGAALLWGSYVKQPILDFLNGIVPANYQFGGFTAIIIVLAIGALIGYIVDKT